MHRGLLVHKAIMILLPKRRTKGDVSHFGEGGVASLHNIFGFGSLVARV